MQTNFTVHWINLPVTVELYKPASWYLYLLMYARYLDVFSSLLFVKLFSDK